MTIEEARSRVSEIVSAAYDYQSSVNNLQSELVSFSSNLNSMYSSVASEINQSSIIEYCSTNSTEVSNALSSTLSAISSALSILSQDATRKIKEIVDAYNNSIDPKEGGERLPYTTVTLAAGGGDVSVFSGGGSKTSGSSGRSTNYQSNSHVSSTPPSEGYNGNTGGYQEPSEEVAIESSEEAAVESSDEDVPSDDDIGDTDEAISGSDDIIEEYIEDDEIPGEEEVNYIEEYSEIEYYLEQLSTTGIYSDDIENWEELIKEFLKENNLDYYVNEIKLDGNIIKCTLFNNIEYELDEVTNVEELLKKLKEVIKMATIK